MKILHLKQNGSLFLLFLALLCVGVGLFFSSSVSAAGLNYGPQVYDLTLYEAVFGKDATGRPVVYAPIVGDPCKLVIADMQSKQVLKVIPLPGAKGAWTITISTDGKVWLGTYGNGHVYRYDPITGTLTDMGASPTGSNVLYGLAPGSNGSVYGGSYGQAKLFAYTNNGKSHNLGSVYPDVYARDVAVDVKHSILYAGIGAIGTNVVRYDLKTGLKKPILPVEYQTDSFADDVNLVSNKLFVKLEPSFRELVLDPLTGKPDVVMDGITKKQQEYFRIGSRGVSTLAPDRKSVYFSYKYLLYRYDLTTKTYLPVVSNRKTVSLSGNVIGWGWIEFNEPNYPGKTLVGMVGNYDGRAFRYNPTTGAYEVFTLPLPPQPLDLYHVVAGPDGKVYSSAYINGSLGVYDSTTGKRTQYPNLGQVEGWTWSNGKLYAGTYPEGKLLEYDPSKPWLTKQNPRTLFSLKEHEQIRPVAVVVNKNKLYVGSRSEYGTWGGALSVFNLANSEGPSVYRNIVLHQSITAIAAKNDAIWVGTSIDGGDATTPKASKAVLFQFNPTTGKKLAEYSPLVTGTPYRISGLTYSPDGKLWGISDGILFQFDPVNKQALRQVTLVNRGVSTGASLGFYLNGYLYVTTDGKLFKVDIKTMKSTQIPYTTNLYRLTLVGKDLYMKAGPQINMGVDLVKYAP
jgi:streptogramin lyase